MSILPDSSGSPAAPMEHTYQNGRLVVPKWWPATVQFAPKSSRLPFTPQREMIIAAFLEELLQNENPRKYGQVGDEAWVGELLKRMNQRWGNKGVTGHNLMHWLVTTDLVRNFQKICEAASERDPRNLIDQNVGSDSTTVVDSAVEESRNRDLARMPVFLVSQPGGGTIYFEVPASSTSTCYCYDPASQTLAHLNPPEEAVDRI